MAKKSVLAIGIDPALVDFTAMPQFTPEMFHGYIDAELERVRGMGYDVTSCLIDLGDTAEAVAKTYKITREDADRFAEHSFSRAVEAQKSCFLSGEIIPLVSETFDRAGYKPRGIQLPRGTETLSTDTHIRPSSYEALSKIRPAFGGVQTGGNSSAIVDGAAAALVSSGGYARAKGKEPLARVAAVAAVGVPPETMSLGPAPAIRRLLDGAGLALEQIDRFEINEAFAAAGHRHVG